MEKFRNKIWKQLQTCFEWVSCKTRNWNNYFSAEVSYKWTVLFCIRNTFFFLANHRNMNIWWEIKKYCVWFTQFSLLGQNEALRGYFIAISAQICFNHLFYFPKCKHLNVSDVWDFCGFYILSIWKD